MKASILELVIFTAMLVGPSFATELNLPTVCSICKAKTHIERHCPDRPRHPAPN
ncbi:hypothetical protein PGT21_035490 [Puccinia graminis f. sp. tritici]|uniref:Uncharacterized protein n=1 Tax=Puccinia graminis f. sp. tritici TaxID=56615 RepID=A0A5B0QCY2_PUCGR|nr:hypothetical protein PGT21_035490 [Puccinia graminis f. sp. tritici]